MSKEFNLLDEWEEIITEYDSLMISLNGKSADVITESVDKFCVEKMRGLLSSYYENEIVEMGKT